MSFIVLCCCPAGKVDYHEGPAGGYDDEWFHPHREPRRDYYPVDEGKVRAYVHYAVEHREFHTCR